MADFMTGYLIGRATTACENNEVIHKTYTVCSNCPDMEPEILLSFGVGMFCGIVFIALAWAMREH